MLALSLLSLVGTLRAGFKSCAFRCGLQLHSRLAGACGVADNDGLR